MLNTNTIAITGIGWEIPGWNEQPISGVLKESVIYGDFDPIKTLGKKGLRYKDRATQLALCAVYKALEDRGLIDVEPVKREKIGIIVSSNLGNMSTVCQESEIINKEHVDQTSPMNLPVASSNVIPSSIAIRFGFKAVNLMLCNGATSGIDAINMAAHMLRSGRAEKMLVVGVESLNAVTEKLMRECDPDNHDERDFRLGELAACLIMEPLQGDAIEHSYGKLGGYKFITDEQSWTSSIHEYDMWFVPSKSSERSRAFIEKLQENEFSNVSNIDISRNTGELYGALGVFQTLVAVSLLKNSSNKSALVSNGFTFGDGLSSIQLNA